MYIPRGNQLQAGVSDRHPHATVMWLCQAEFIFFQEAGDLVDLQGRLCLGSWPNFLTLSTNSWIAHKHNHLVLPKTFIYR
jgi:hypothetical protein